MKAAMVFAVWLVLAFAICYETQPSFPETALPTGARFAQNTAQLDPARKQQVVAQYGKLPLSFEVNQGQTDTHVKFLSRGTGYTLFLTSDEAVLSLYKPNLSGVSDRTARKWPRKVKTSVLRIKLIGANRQPKVAGLAELPGKIHYLIGNDPEKWQSNISSYSKVKYEGVYPGIDLIYYGNQSQLEHDFIVAPSANPDAIVLEFEGAEKVNVDARGDLVIRINAEEVRLHRPRAYQEGKAFQRDIPAQYVLQDDRVRFQLGAYDPSTPLVIDPVLSYSTYLGGSGDDLGFGIKTDSSGNAYVTGETGSADFPTTTGALDTTLAGSTDVFITKLNPTGTARVYSTFLGGNGTDTGFAIAVDSAGNAYVTGSTSSTDFPTSGAFQTGFGGGSTDAFVTKLNAAGSALLYSTYLGGTSDDPAFGIATDSSGNAYVGGITTSVDFPTSAGAFQTVGGGLLEDAFVAKLNPTQTGAASRVYSTYLGGSAGNDECFAIAVDSSGNAHVTGLTDSTNFPTTPTTALQTVYGGGLSDAFVTKLNAAGTGPLLYSTYLGGGSDDFAFGIAVDSTGNSYATGATSSTNFTTSPGAFQTGFAGPAGLADAFVTKLDSTKSGAASLVYSTYLGGSAPSGGGSGDDEGFAIAVDSAGNSYITGVTDSPDFPKTPLAFQATFGGGGGDAFVTKLNPAGTALVYSSFLGGSNVDQGFGITVDASNIAYLTGSTSSADFTTTSGVSQPAFGGGGFDSFVAKVTAIPVVNLSPTSLTFGSQVVGSASAPQTATLTNNGDGPLTIASIAASGDFAQTNTCGTSVAPGASCTINVTFTPTAAGPRTGAVTITDNASGSPRTITLSGNGTDFSLAVSPTSATVTAGQSTTYTLTITPLGGFNGSVALSCSGAPTLATCTISPNSVTLSGAGAVTATATVTTTASSLGAPRPGRHAPPPWPGQVTGLWLLLLGCGALAVLVAAKRRRALWLVPGAAVLLLLLCIGCNGNGGQPGTPPGTSTLTFTGTSGSLTHTTTASLTVR